MQGAIPPLPILFRGMVHKFYPGQIYSTSYQLPYNVEFKLAKFLQLIGTIKRTIFKKVRTETILKIHNTLVVPTFYIGKKIGL